MKQQDLIDFDTTLETHSWTAAHMDAFQLDIIKLKSTPQVPACVMQPEYMESSCQKIFIRCSCPQAKPLSHYDSSLWGKNTKSVFSLVLNILESLVFIHQNGCVVRQFTKENVLVGASGFKIIVFYQETQQNTLTVRCPLEFCSNEFYNYSIYSDPQFTNLVLYRQFLAFPCQLRLRQNIKFTVNTDIYSLGVFIFELITNKKAPDPWKVLSLKDLEAQRLECAKMLSEFGFGDKFNKVVLKMMFMVPNQYFYNLLEIQSEIQMIYKEIQQKSIEPISILQFEQFQTLLENKSQFNVTTVRSVIDHLIGAIQYTQVQKMKLQTFDYISTKLHKLSVTITQTPSPLLNFSDKSDLSKMAADKTGKLAIIQGYFGSGKTECIFDVLQFFASQFFSFCCYIPMRPEGSFEVLNIQNLFLIPQEFTKNITSQIQVFDFYHYITIHLLYAVFLHNVKGISNKIKQQFSSQYDINKIYAICPGFYKNAEFGQYSKQIQLTSDITKDVLIRLLDIIQQNSLLMVLAFDDLQSSFLQDETKIILNLLELFPRLCIITSESPSLNCNNQSFSVSGSSSGPLTDKVCQLFSQFADDNKQDIPKNDIRTIQNQKSDIMSVGSCRSATSGTQMITNQTEQNKIVEIRTKSFIYIQAQIKKLMAMSLTVNYFSQQATDDYLSLFGLSNQEINLTIIRKSQGSIKLIRQTIQQLYQHSGWVTINSAALQTTELIQSDEMIIITTYIRAKNQLQIQQKDMEILQTCSIFGYFVDLNWLYNVMDMRQDQISSLCTQLGSVHGYLFSFSLPNCSLKHKNYQSLTNEYKQEITFVWQSTTACKIFLESATSQYSYQLLKTAQFLMDRYIIQFSELEVKSERYSFYLPKYSDDQCEQYIEFLTDMLNSKVQKNLNKYNERSSIIKLLKRSTQSKLVKQISLVKPIQYTTFGQNFDGLFVSIELLTQCLNPCTDQLPDIFDQIELMQLNYELLKKVQFYGLVPNVYFKFLDYAIQQQNETKSQLINLGIEQKVQFMDVTIPNIQNYRGFNLMNQENNFKSYLIIDPLYEVFNKLQQDFISLQIQQLRHTNFTNLTKINLKVSFLEFVKIYNNIAVQFILEQKYDEALTLLLRITNGVGMKNIVVDSDQIQQYFADCCQKIVQLKKINVLQLSNIEENVQKSIFYTAMIGMIQNKQMYALNILIGLVNRGFAIGMSDYALTGLCLLFSRYEYFNIAKLDQVYVLKSMQQLYQHVSNFHLRYLIVMLIFDVKYKSIIVDQLCFEQFRYQMSNYFAEAKTNPFGIEILLIIPMFTIISFFKFDKQFTAQLIQNFLKDLTYVNLPQVIPLLISAGICAMKYIQQTNEVPPKLVDCNTIYEHCSILIQLETFLEFKQYTDAFKVGYLNEHDGIFNKQLNIALLKLKLEVNELHVYDLLQQLNNLITNDTKKQMKEQLEQLKQMEVGL